MRPWSAWLALGSLLPLLAGCAAPSPPAAEPVATAAPAPGALVWELAGCQAITWDILVPASRLAARMPEGFTPAPVQGTSLPAGSEQATTLAFEAVECATGYGSELQVTRSVPFARLTTPVLPPSGKSDARPGTAHAVLWAEVVADDAWRARLGAAGLPVHDGGTLVGANAQGYSGRMAIDGVGVFSLTGRPDATSRAAQDAAFRDFAPAGDGPAIVGTRTGIETAGGVGVWELTPDSWVAQVVGATTGVAVFQLATWDLPHMAVIRPGTPSGGGPGDSAVSFI